MFFLLLQKIFYDQNSLQANTYKKFISQMYWFIYNESIESTCDSYIYRTALVIVIELTVIFIEAFFESFYYAVTMFIAS